MIHKIFPTFQDLDCIMGKQMSTCIYMISSPVLYLLHIMKSLGGKKSISKSAGCVRVSVVMVLVLCPIGLD